MLLEAPNNLKSWYAMTVIYRDEATLLTIENAYVNLSARTVRWAISNAEIDTVNVS